MRTLWQAAQQTVKLLGPHRKLWLPFLLVAMVEVGGLLLLWLAPQPPFTRLLAPPIRFFFGDRILHYPWHLWFLYHAMKHTHMAASLLVGAFMTGIACVMVGQSHADQPLSLRAALASRQVRYGTVVLLWLLLWGMGRGAMTAVTRYAPSSQWALWLGVGLTVLIQTLFIYAIPAAVYDRVNWWRALGRSVRETCRDPLAALVVVGVPSAAMIGFISFAPPARVSQWMLQTAPEVAIPLIAARLLVWLVADVVATVGAAHLWWIHRAAQQPAAAAVRTVGRLTRPAPIVPPIAALPLILTLLTANGCSATYNGERLFWKAQQFSAPIGKDPSKATAAQFAQAVTLHEAVIRAAQGTSWAARAQFAIGSLQALQQHYPQAREAYALVVQNYPQHPDYALSARLAAARTYEAEQLWEEAAKMYYELADYHPWSRVGLEALIYVAAHYERDGKREQAEHIYERAVRHYLKRLAEAPSRELASQIRVYLSMAYQRLEKWEEAAKTLEELAQQSVGINRPLVLLTLASLYQTKIHHPQQAAGIYLKLSEEFPDHPLAQTAKTQLERLDAPAAPTAAPARAQ
ncbi:MAG: tetratricopeptide repeat protein [Candidatus Omnitrophica bacterium]|nr:tetratricopeptide repeat protein [Candidatus Omnitrophota bacterium]